MIPSLACRRVRTLRPGIAVLLAVCVAWPGLAAEQSGEQITPLLLAVHDAPMPFNGSDGRTHLVYGRLRRRLARPGRLARVAAARRAAAAHQRRQILRLSQ
jgi:hypothetical protein